jgi:Cu2+-containing amine oxidase
MTLADVRTEHPLAMTTAEEVERVRATLAEAGLLGEHVRFAFLLPEEPPKAEVLAFTRGRGRRPALPRGAARPRHGPLLGHGRLRDPERGRLLP